MRTINEAARAASESGERIFCEDRGEWIEYSSGAFRYCSNRAEVKFSLKDLTSDRWLLESDFIVTHNGRVESAVNELLDGLNLVVDIKQFITKLGIGVEKQNTILASKGLSPTTHRGEHNGVD